MLYRLFIRCKSCCSPCQTSGFRQVDLTRLQVWIGIIKILIFALSASCVDICNASRRFENTVERMANLGLVSWALSIHRWILPIKWCSNVQLTLHAYNHVPASRPPRYRLVQIIWLYSLWCLLCFDSGQRLVYVICILNMALTDVRLTHTL